MMFWRPLISLHHWPGRRTDTTAAQALWRSQSSATDVVIMFLLFCLWGQNGMWQWLPCSCSSHGEASRFTQQQDFDKTGWVKGWGWGWLRVGGGGGTWGIIRCFHFCTNKFPTSCKQIMAVSAGKKTARCLSDAGVSATCGNNMSGFPPPVTGKITFIVCLMW